MRCVSGLAIVLLAVVTTNVGHAQDQRSTGQWRPLPLITDGKVDPAWTHTGFGSFAVDDGALRTDCDERGLGLLVYTREKLGNCQIRVTYRTKDRSNAGVYVRIDDPMIPHLKDNVPPASRKPGGGLTDAGLAAMKEASEKELGPWYAVHHGFEVQIADVGDAWHRTGSIYSLAKAGELPEKKPGDGWRTMVITLKDQTVLVDVDGKRVTEFDASAKNLPARKAWHEPKREHKRPTRGYIGLQNHDPGDVVWFKEVAVRGLAAVEK